MSRLLPLARRHAPALAMAEGALLAATAADVALLVLLGRFVDRGFTPAGGSPWPLVGLALGAAAARAVATYAGARLSLGTSTRVVGELQEQLFGRLQELSLEFFHRTRPGDLMARLFHDIEAAARLVTDTVGAAVSAPARIAALVALLASLHAGLALGLVLVAAPGAALARLLGSALRRRFDRLYEELAGLYDAAQESLGAAELVRSLGREAEETEAFAVRTRALVAREVALRDLEALVGPAGGILRTAALVAALAYGAAEVAAGRLTPGGLTTALGAAWALLAALESLLALSSSAQGGLAAAARVFAVLDERPAVAPPPAGRPATFTEALRFEGVSFAYPGRPPALDGIMLTLRAGERLALVGPNGSGKTTLLRLMLRLFDPTAGRVSLDGVDLRDLGLPGLRALFAVVPQDVVLFDRTIRDNVALGRTGATLAEVEVAVRVAGLDAVAARLPDGLDTRVGTRGVQLSAGERQRVALARAALRGAPVLLLDEATSALDSTAREQVEGALAALARGRTIVTVTHDPASLEDADRIVVLDRGRIVEEGTRASLLARGGLYRRLFDSRESRGPIQPQARSGP